MLVMALEDYDEVTGKAAKAADPAARTWSARRRRSPRRLRRGRVAGIARPHAAAIDLPLHRQLYGKPEEAVIAELGDLIYRDPESQAWQTADEYLSGNVRGKARRRRGGRPGLRPQRRGPAGSAARGRAARRHRRQSRCPVDTGERHPGVRRRAVRRRPVGDPDRPSEEGRRVERRGRPCRRGVGRRHRRVRHAQGQRHLAARAGPQHEDAGDLRHDPDGDRRGAGGQPGGHAGRPREAEADQGAVQSLGVRRARAHRAAGAAL